MKKNKIFYKINWKWKWTHQWCWNFFQWNSIWRNLIFLFIVMIIVNLKKNAFRLTNSKSIFVNTRIHVQNIRKKKASGRIVSQTKEINKINRKNKRECPMRKRKREFTVCDFNVVVCVNLSMFMRTRTCAHIKMRKIRT